MEGQGDLEAPPTATAHTTLLKSHYDLLQAYYLLLKGISLQPAASILLAVPPAVPQASSPSAKVPLRAVRCQSLFSGTATPVLLLIPVLEAPALRVRDSLVYHWRYCTHLRA